MSTFLIIYVIISVYVMVGFGFIAADIGKWLEDTNETLPKYVQVYELVKCIILWPFFDIKKLREKYGA